MTKTAEHRRQLQQENDEIVRRLRKWQDAFEAGDKTAAALGTDLQQTLRKVVLLRPPPPNLYTEASITKFQTSIRSIFLSQDNALTKNYLRFLVDKIVVKGPVERDPAVSPTFAVGWLRLQDSNLRPGG
jgi:hypothetical protein